MCDIVNVCFSFAYATNLVLCVFFGYVVVGVHVIWKDSHVSSNSSGFDEVVHNKLLELVSKNDIIKVWSIISAVVYFVTLVSSILLLIGNKRGSLSFMLTWICTSIVNIILTLVVTVLYILTYYKLVNYEYPDGFDKSRSDTEVWITVGLMGLYCITYSVLVILLWKYKMFPPKIVKQPNKNTDVSMDNLGFGGVIEEVGSPEEIPGYMKYTGQHTNGGSDKVDNPKPKNFDNTRRRQEMNGPNMYSEPRTNSKRLSEMDNTYMNFRRSESSAGPSRASFQIGAEENAYSQVPARIKPVDASIVQSHSTSKLGDDYSVEPYYQGDELEYRQKMYNQIGKGRIEKSLEHPYVEERDGSPLYSNMAYLNDDNTCKFSSFKKVCDV